MSKVVSINRRRSERSDDYFGIEGEENTDKHKYSDSMREVIRLLEDLEVFFEVKSLSHIKIGHVNYYPSTKTINLDGLKKFKQRGLAFLKDVLKKEGIL